MRSPVTATPVANEGYDPRIRVFRCGDIVDSFAVVTERYVMLVDTLVNLESIETVVHFLADELENRELLVINTHGDWDHVWGNGLFLAPSARYPAPVIGHARTAEIIESPEAAAFLEAFKAEHPEEYDSAGQWPPTVQFDGAMRIEGGDLTVELIPTPGHTSDHHSIWIPELRAVLPGDAAELPFPMASEPESLPELRASLRQLDDLQATTALYCHAPSVTDPALIRHNIAYFDELERRCRDAIAREIEGEEAGSRLIDWPFERALPPGWSIDTIPSPDFYRPIHEQSIRAMMSWLNLQA